MIMRVYIADCLIRFLAALEMTKPGESFTIADCRLSSPSAAGFAYTDMDSG